MWRSQETSGFGGSKTLQLWSTGWLRYPALFANNTLTVLLSLVYPGPCLSDFDIFLRDEWVVVSRFSLMPKTFSSNVAPRGHSSLYVCLCKGQNCGRWSGVCGLVPHEQFLVYDSPERHRDATVSSAQMMICWWRFRPSIWLLDGGLCSLAYRLL